MKVSKNGQVCILFDLDGTLVSTGGAGNRALEKAFLSIFGISRAMKNVNPAGKTDPAIIREIFLNCLERDCTDREMNTVQEKYLEFLGGECENSSGYRVMKGIPQLLEQLQKKNVLMGLGTGNLEKGARIKLKRAQLNQLLPFGGFGSDSEDRAQLLKIAHKKAERYSGRSLNSEEIFVVGDTERDIFAARKAKYKVIAMGTGHTPTKILKQFEPDFFLPNFKRPDDFLNIIWHNNKWGE